MLVNSNTYSCRFLTVPVMNIVVSSLFLEHYIRVTLVELSVELGVLLDGLELLNSVDLHGILASLLKEGSSLRLKLIDVVVEVSSIEHTVLIVSFNHCMCVRLV